MPYRFVENHSECDGDQGALVLEETGEVVGCHSSRESALQQQRAIEANKHKKGLPKHSMFVSPTKSTLKDLNDKGRFGGFLVVFGSVKEHDFERDFFNSNTDFWLENGEGKSAVIYDHGLDEVLGKNRLDKGSAILTIKDAGVWMETQLQRRNEYEELVHKLAREGKLGLSSGTASHLVEREVEGQNEKGHKVTHIKQWPLGVDASLTPQPSEPRTKVVPLDSNEGKSIKSYLEDEGINTSTEHSTQVQGSNVKASQEEIEERYEEFRDTVNMSASEIENWAEAECSDKASDKPKTVRNRVIKLLRTNKEDWGQNEYDQAGRVISFVNRMKGVEDGEPVEEGCPSKRNISLRNWGYDPTKSFDIDLLLDLQEINTKLASKSEHQYSSGDLVSWEGGDAQGRIVRQVGTNDSVSPSTTDRSFSGEENDPGYLIELVDKDENGNIVGRDETVFHLESTLSKITEDDVKSSLAKLSESLDNINEQLSSII